MDCQQILELNTSSANEVAESDLKNIYPQTRTEAKGNIKFELCKEWIALIHKTYNGKSVEICFKQSGIAAWIMVSHFFPFSKHS